LRDLLGIIPRGQGRTVGSGFKIQLNDLLNVIRKTETHWIRCIKPNTQSKANMFDDKEGENK